MQQHLNFKLCVALGLGDDLQDVSFALPAELRDF